MNPEALERRQRQRSDDILTRIEDVTYAVLRDRSSKAADPADKTFAVAAAK
jgi:hypothetical protein